MTAGLPLDTFACERASSTPSDLAPPGSDSRLTFRVHHDIDGEIPWLIEH